MTTLAAKVAKALVPLLPLAGRIEVKPMTETGPGEPNAGDEGATATFVGPDSAEMLLALRNADELVAAAGGDTGMKLSDLLQPVFDGATAVLGTGVVTVNTPSAVSLMTDEATEHFVITAGGKPAGQFSILIREASEVPAKAEVGSQINLGRIADMEMRLAVEIGRNRMSVRDVLGMEPGSVIELDRSAGAPADVLVNGKVIARGEVVVVDQDYAVRILNVMDAADSED